jgi:hypothetical protein
MHIVKLSAENVKCLKAVSITPQGHVVTIGGKNRAGKSTVLDCIAMALGGKALCPEVPIRTGQTHAKVTVQLDGDPPLLVTRTFTQDGGSSLTVSSPDGNLKYSSPQKMLDEITGRLMFDPLAFARQPAQQQLETLRSLTGLDFTDLDGRRRKLYDERTLAGRDVAGRKGQIEAMPHYGDAPAQEIVIADLVGELEQANAQNRGRDEAGREVRRLQGEVDECRLLVDKAEREILKWKTYIVDQQAKAKAFDRAAGEAMGAFNALAPADTAPILQQIQSAEQANAQVRTNHFRQKIQADFDKAKAEYDRLTVEIEAIDADKARRIQGAKFPIADLGFAEDGVTFNGLPFSQASSAEQLRISVAICLALHPKLAHVPIYDGSLLDADSLAQLDAMALEADGLVWIERVSSDGKGCSILIENGEVKGPEAQKETVTSATDSGTT